jgi:hypothetical protein
MVSKQHEPGGIAAQSPCLAWPHAATETLSLRSAKAAPAVIPGRVDDAELE